MPSLKMLHIYRYLYSERQNKWYPQRCLLAHFEVTFYLIVPNLLANNNLYVVMLLWASKFATAEIECSFEMGK